jgi:hypothetical protein
VTFIRREKNRGKARWMLYQFKEKEKKYFYSFNIIQGMNILSFDLALIQGIFMVILWRRSV